jgi:NAD(P)H dehydrogenase (quinone)
VGPRKGSDDQCRPFVPDAIKDLSHRALRVRRPCGRAGPQIAITGSEIGGRAVQHRNIIPAAKDAGVDMSAYTSALRADTSPLFPAGEHRDTEAALKVAGVPFVLLRNGWYTEVYTWRPPLALRRGAFLVAVGEGRITSAARAGIARAAAAVLTGEGHASRT